MKHAGRKGALRSGKLHRNSGRAGGNGGVQVACFGVGHGFGVDAGMEIGAEGKASVCKGIWWKRIGKRPAISKAVSELETLRSDG